uniref:Uncharacterized protein n=1 Tax=Arundo donax TaxID=35708 RepID=A0A0A9E3A8_ARUDO
MSVIASLFTAETFSSSLMLTLLRPHMDVVLTIMSYSSVPFFCIPFSYKISSPSL